MNIISRRRFLNSASFLSLGAVAFPREFFGQLQAQTPNSPVVSIINEASRSAVSVTQLRNNISLIEGSGGNIAVLAGRDAKLMVDAGINVSKEKIKQALNGMNKAPLKYLINTHWHFDHASGNPWVHEAGATIIAQKNTRKHLSVTTRVEDWNYTFKPTPTGGLPTVQFDKDHSFRFEGESLALEYYGPAHTDSDICVHFENADVLHVADTWWNGFYPFIDLSTGGSIKGMIDASIANVKRMNPETIVIPGHGPLGNKAQMIEYSDMLQGVAHNISTLKKQGRQLNETIAAKPTKSFDAKWGKFVISPDLFTSLVYRSVQAG